ncbi:MAG: RNA polymerase factor sigma-54 [Legionellales bacterium]|nr:RNA polymerase factor sigma-54 [Legionellales bacterium]
MKQTLQTKLTQHLTLTPQLQQAIRLLQLSSLELRHEIEQAVEANPLLEYQDDNSSPAEETPKFDDINHAEHSLRWNEQSLKLKRDPYAIAEYEIQGATTTSLRDHLLWQMRLSHFSEIDTAIATAIIDAINDDGFLTCSLNDIRVCLGKMEVDDDEIAMVLRRIQHFDPTGVGARDLKECLLIQLNTFPSETPLLLEAQTIIQYDLDLLAHHDYRQLLKKYKFKESCLQEIIRLIKSLNPKPGASIASPSAEYIIPDLIIEKYQNDWQVRINDESLPKVQMNQDYDHLLDKQSHQAEYEFLHHHLQEARWFLKSIHSRHDTLLRVAQNIVRHQQDFFEHGAEHMKPLILQTVADDLGLHESTVSRVTTHKYILTPRGLFELKYFFSSHLTTNNHEECSSTAIRAMIKKLIAEENSHKPLSDNRITQILARQGIHVARRTVAKYREAMVIPPSNERKCL